MLSFACLGHDDDSDDVVCETRCRPVRGFKRAGKGEDNARPPESRRAALLVGGVRVIGGIHVRIAIDYCHCLILGGDVILIIIGFVKCVSTAVPVPR